MTTRRYTVALQLRLFITNPEIDLEAYVVVDSLVEGYAMGGTRMTTTVNVDEVAHLAHNMSLKLALADLPIGGAKAGIRCGLPIGAERDRVIADFGQAIGPLLHGGIYLGVDQGVSFRDRDNFLRAGRFKMNEQQKIAHLPCTWSDLWTHCSDITGFGICEGFDATSDVLRLSNYRTAVIQGFGAVGRGVALGLERRGFHIVAVADRDGTIVDDNGLPVQALINATDSTGTIDRTALPPGLHYRNEPESWLQIDADVLILAAVGDAIHAGNVDRVRTQIVIEGGNFACSKPAHRLLTEKKIPVLPAIVVNAGGAILTGLIWSNMTPKDLGITDFVSWLYAEVSARIRHNMHVILDRSILDPRPLSDIAEALAFEKLQKLPQQ